ncbi:MFS transporter [Parasphaerochaeta coccoides]|uniref:Major facilitator superfamily MFS_1 n=1 Tax=Parasphaerochaeta coccoides (strain ATCC BAA-1237 / DSM 17374 / SPN1) TaxID=760011 RepID=F4GKI1_PARC1|nr:MFS transporter [Parasphaerochaeta coccoides]AEC02864.1 major facilitator superfamily MFS_1 [Parasphaerochaeta coccoides DSM 17374]
MATLLLVIIYASFISLGLPDALLGSTWPVIRVDIAASVGAAGYISFIASACTILSSIASGRILARFGVGKVTVFSVFLTAIALYGFSKAPAYWWFLILAFPLGLGAGGVDTGLNWFIAGNYEARHMNWLHAFWGVGALLGPNIMAGNLTAGGTWRNGYGTVALLQSILVIILTGAIPLWKIVADRKALPDRQKVEEQARIASGQPMLFYVKRPGVLLSMGAFLLYCAFETTLGLWSSSYLVETRSLTPVLAARWTSLFYGSIMAGRLISGFLTFTLSSRVIFRSGMALMVAGSLCFLLPVGPYGALAGIILAGLGGGPLLPTWIHLTPRRFGTQYSGRIIGIQMASSYVGISLLSPLFGLIFSKTAMDLLPVVLLSYAVGMSVLAEAVEKRLARH